MAVDVLRKNPNRRQRAENSLEGWRVRFRRRRQIFYWPRFEIEEIGEAQSRDDVDRLHDKWPRLR
jgi:hypothetical protein